MSIISIFIRIWIILLANVPGSISQENSLNIQVNRPVLLEPDGGVTRNKNSFFGSSIAISKNNIFVGAPKYSFGGGIFRCNAATQKCSYVQGFPNHG